MTLPLSPGNLRVTMDALTTVEDTNWSTSAYMYDVSLSHSISIKQQQQQQQQISNNLHKSLIAKKKKRQPSLLFFSMIIW